MFYKIFKNIQVGSSSYPGTFFSVDETTDYITPYLCSMLMILEEIIYRCLHRLLILSYYFYLDFAMYQLKITNEMYLLLVYLFELTTHVQYVYDYSFKNALIKIRNTQNILVAYLLTRIIVGKLYLYVYIYIIYEVLHFCTV